MVTAAVVSVPAEVNVIIFCLFCFSEGLISSWEAVIQMTRDASVIILMNILHVSFLSVIEGMSVLSVYSLLGIVNLSIPIHILT